jgi:ASPIC and UnbV/Secretion system C-terminal sorting domain/FG-GAP-like repeat/Ig-like domain CHU_C associated
MKKIYLSIAMLCCAAIGSFAQSFTNSSVLPGTYNSGGVTGVADVNFDGLDDIIVMHQSNHLYVLFQQGNGTFTQSDYGTVSGGQQWGMCVGDVDNDRYLDVLCGGNYDGVHLVNIDDATTSAQTNYSWAYIFMQACNFADIDNDGWADAWGCHDDGHSAIFHNDGTGALTDGASMIDLTYYPEVSGGNDNSGNYGTTWTDFDRDGDLDLFIAKCRQFISDPYDARRTNILLMNDGNGNYTHHNPVTGVAHAAERGLVNLQQSWTADFADVDNDGDFDAFITTHSGTLELYENDGNGYFTNITAGSGLEISGFFLQGKLEDFDNDGFVDILYSGGNHGYFRNNGNKTFTAANSTFAAAQTMHSFGVGDLNHDGWLDVYGTYGTSYVTPSNTADRVFLNNGGSNKWVAFNLEGTVSNKRAIGAIVEITGAFGTQIREVRAGESYGITNSYIMHFGLGTANEITEAKVYWPSGLVTTIANPAVNSWHNVVEEQCLFPTVTTTGGTQICPGGQLVLTCDIQNGSYQWNNGETGSSITITAPGLYSVSVDDGTGCTGVSNSLNVTQYASVAPTVTAEGLTQFCEGYSVSLAASDAASYLWSNGETTQTISALTTGLYTVQTTDFCGTALVSESVAVEVLDSPSAPIADGALVLSGNTAQLTATGTNINWYDAANATTPIATGNTFTTPSITQNVSYWVEDVTVHGGELGIGGKTQQTTNNSGAYMTNFSYWLLFDVAQDLYIDSVKVFCETGGAGVKEIQVVDAAGNITASGTFSVPDGESYVALNFFVPAGTGYGLRANTTNHHLWRDSDTSTNSPFGFPYDLNGLGAITGTNVTTAGNSDNYYYYFYDWHVSTPRFECAGPRTEVQVIINGVEELNGLSSTVLYPNPVNGVLNISFNSLRGDMMHIQVIDQVGRVVEKTQHNMNVGRNTLNLDLTNVAAGIYNIQFEVAGKTSTQKIVVE